MALDFVERDNFNNLRLFLSFFFFFFFFFQKDDDEDGDDYDDDDDDDDYLEFDDMANDEFKAAVQVRGENFTFLHCRCSTSLIEFEI